MKRVIHWGFLALCVALVALELRAKAAEDWTFVLKRDSYVAGMHYVTFSIGDAPASTVNVTRDSLQCEALRGRK